jgi:hypothetical protein
MGHFQKELRKMKFCCLVPGCGNPAIRSHSQQKEGQLRAIAKDGMVYSPEKNYYKGFKQGLDMRRIGIGQASTFPGFCDYHDKELFSNVEVRPLTKDDHTQALPLLLRSLAFEYTQKRRGAIFLEWLLKETKGIIPSESSEEMAAFQGGMKLFLDFDGPFYLDAAFEALTTNSDWLVTEWQIIPKNIMASSSCAFSPLRDAHIDYKINHRKDREPGPLVMFNLIPEENQTHIVVSWHQKDSKHTDWIRESMSDMARLELFINQCAIAESEDTCLNPDLWDNTPRDVQNDALNAIRSYLFRGLLDECPLVIKL